MKLDLYNGSVAGIVGQVAVAISTTETTPLAREC